MASVFILPDTDIDYSLSDGRVRSLHLRGVHLFDESTGFAVDGWREALAAFVVEQGLNIDPGEGRYNGRHAFVNKLIEDGLAEAG